MLAAVFRRVWPTGTTLFQDRQNPPPRPENGRPPHTIPRLSPDCDNADESHATAGALDSASLHCQPSVKSPLQTGVDREPQNLPRTQTRHPTPTNARSKMPQSPEPCETPRNDGAAELCVKGSPYAQLQRLGQCRDRQKSSSLECGSPRRLVRRPNRRAPLFASNLILRRVIIQVRMPGVMHFHTLRQETLPASLATT